MALLSRAAAALERRGVDPRSPWGDSAPPPPSAGGGAVAGTNVTENTALQIAAVYGSVSVIADSLSSLPIDLMSSPHRRSGMSLAPSQLVIQPFEEISTQDWWVQFVMSLALRGNFVGHIIDRDANLFPTQIKPIHPDHAQVRRLADGTIEYRFNGVPVRLDDVFHVRYLSVAESLMGLNPIDYLRNVLGLARAADMYGGAFFQNSALPSLTLNVPPDVDLDTDETKALKQEWMQTHGGIGASSLPAVLTGGIEAKPISITPEQAQFLQSRQFSASTISGQIFRVPPHMIGIVDRTTSWGTGIEQQETGFVRNTLIGYLSRGERALTAIHPPGQFVRFDLSERLRGDRLQRAQAAALEIASGTLLPDEARAAEDRPPLPGGIGQTAMAPINAQSLKQMAEASVAAAQADQPPPDQSPSDDQQRLFEIAAEQRATRGMLEVMVGRDPLHVELHPGNVTVERTNVNVDVPPANPTPVNVEAPAVNVEAPNVNVEPPSVSVEPRFEVEAPNVTVKPQIHVPEPKPRRKRVERNKKGQIERVIEEGES